MALSHHGKQLSVTQRTNLLTDIGKRIRDWIPRDTTGTSYNAFEEYVKSGYKTLPFSGGWLDQPVWIQEDFRLFRDVLDFHILNEELNTPNEGGTVI